LTRNEAFSASKPCWTRVRVVGMGGVTTLQHPRRRHSTCTLGGQIVASLKIELEDGRSFWLVRFLAGIMENCVAPRVYRIDTGLHARVLKQPCHEIITALMQLIQERRVACGIQHGGIRPTFKQSIEDVEGISIMQGRRPKSVRCVHICPFLLHQPQDQWHALNENSGHIQGHAPECVPVIDAS